MPAAPTDKAGSAQGTAANDPGLRAWIEYLRDMGIYDLYQRAPVKAELSDAVRERLLTRPAPLPSTAAPARAAAGQAGSPPPTRPVPGVAPGQGVPAQGMREDSSLPVTRRAPAPAGAPPVVPRSTAVPAEAVRSYFTTEEEPVQTLPPELAAPMPKPNPLETLLPQPAAALPVAARAAALERVRAEIGDCTRCPLAYAGRHTIVFGEGDPSAELMFVGEGPGADEDASGRPFVGKAGQLLTNMIGAMGLQREQVYIANIVKCRPPGNRAPEFAEATTCSQFLLQQIDIVRPKVIVALGSTAATYVLGVRQSLASLRGQWFRTREAKVAVTYHPAFLLRDPRQKGEAWKDLQRVMAELGLRAAAAKS